MEPISATAQASHRHPAGRDSHQAGHTNRQGAQRAEEVEPLKKFQQDSLRLLQDCCLFGGYKAGHHRKGLLHVGSHQVVQLQVGTKQSNRSSASGGSIR